MIDKRIANNIIGFMERAPLKAGAEVPAYNEARSALEKIIAAQIEAERLEAELAKIKDKKKAPEPKEEAGADGGGKKD